MMVELEEKVQLDHQEIKENKEQEDQMEGEEEWEDQVNQVVKVLLVLEVTMDPKDLLERLDFKVHKESLDLQGNKD